MLRKINLGQHKKNIHLLTGSSSPIKSFKNVLLPTPLFPTTATTRKTQIIHWTYSITNKRKKITIITNKTNYISRTSGQRLSFTEMFTASQKEASRYYDSSYIWFVPDTEIGPRLQ